MSKPDGSNASLEPQSSEDKSDVDTRGATKNNTSKPEGVRNNTSKPETKSRLFQATAASQARVKSAATTIKKPLVPKLSAAKTMTAVRKGPVKPSQDVAGAAEATWKKSAKVAPTTKRGKATPDKKPSPGGQSTPTNSTMVSKRVVSTPTSETDVTLGCWDASAIDQVNRTQAPELMDDTVLPTRPNLMDETLLAEPVLKLYNMAEDGAKPADVTVKNKTKLEVLPARTKKQVTQTCAKPKQKVMIKAPATVAKVLPAADESDDEYVTDEQLDAAYTRYIQAEFIYMKSKEAEKRTKEECEEQLFRAWSGLEEMRMKYNQKLEEVRIWKTLEMMQESLKVVKSKLQPALEVMEGFQDNFALVATGLDAVKHNLAVQGISIEDQHVAREELDKLSDLFDKFNTETEDLGEAVGERTEEVQAMATEYERLAENFSQALRLSEDCQKLLTTLNQVAMKEASLRTSLMQLEKAEKAQLLDI